MADSGAGLRARWRARSLRARLTVLATALLALGLAAGALALVVALTYALHGAVDTSARRTADQVAALVDTGRPLPEPLPVGDGNTVVVQVVDARGGVRAASAGADHLVPLLRPAELRRVRSGRTVTVSGDRAGVDGPLYVLGREAGPAADRQTVLVAVDASRIGESAEALRTVLLLGFPLLLVLLAGLSWYLVGRALRPVEDLRRGAEDISGAGASRRLPVPAGEDEVRRLAVTLNRMLGRLDAANARQRAFVADAAHELRSPLASARTQLEVARHLGGQADWPRTADGTLLDLARLSRLVDDLLLLARLDAQDPSTRLRRRRVDVADLVADAVRTGYDGRRVAVDAPGPAVVDADPEALRRVVTNLVDNAVRHASSQVCVAASQLDGAVLVTVTDDGPGIPAADRERVFDRFTRLDDARDRGTGGAGLGLAIVRELVLAHGGGVALDDAGPGLRVTVRLPAAAPTDG